MRKAISLIVLTSEGLLLTKKRETWILPGGKPLDGETNYICLFRELKEELPYSQISITHHYKNFIGRTPHKGDLLKNIVYFGKLKGPIKSSNEISEAKYITNFENYNLSDITQKIVNSLKQDKYL
ncbi:MAG TPA: NUDIX domain-containing protein [Candidatus Nanoarchaeia archaeon]|nr:NUDIX domain-containing protein [Candidatus Nanoarchaeia archaeon]